MTFSQTLVFLNNDERWNNLREYSINVYGVKSVTCVFGVVISIICPFIFGLQNILLGLMVTNGEFGKETLNHILQSTRTQLVVIYDLTLFDRKNGEKIKSVKNIWRLANLAIGYLFYVLPIGIILYLFLFVRYTTFVCQELKAPFLLDNNFKPVNDMDEIWQIRKEYLAHGNG